METPISGFSSNLVPDYSKETSQVQIKKGISEGNAQAKGVILSKDSLEIPFEKQVKISSQEAEPGRPSLPPLFRTRFLEDREVEDLSRDYYLALRNSLPQALKEKLNQEEKLLTLADRDPDLAALDGSLKFEANLLALTDVASAPKVGDENTLLGAEREQALPEIVQQELSAYGATVSDFLDSYLSTLSREDPSYEMFHHVSNQIKEALNLLSYDPNKFEE